MRAWAEFFAPTTMDRQMKWKEVGQVNDLRMFELEQYLKGRTVENADGQLVAQTIGAARLTSTGYAAAWALTHYLAKYQREEFQRFLRDTSRLGPLASTGHVVPPGVIPEKRAVVQRTGSAKTWLSWSGVCCYI